ncbi:MAG TPA: SRPBCC family protein [Blastocatellia bacterium]|nr:SRPBCC family protein [Blastocatellia bacterium]
MPANEYQFLTEWRVEAPAELLFDILKEGKDYPEWWPDVYLDARSEPSGRPDGIGDRVHLLTKGWLPYKLRWTAEAVRRDRPREIEIAATGDFVGRGVWRLEPAGAGTRITFDWRLRADKPLLRLLSPIFKPIFKWNHRWAMRTGLGRLRAEAARRSAQDQASNPDPHLKFAS